MRTRLLALTVLATVFAGCGGTPASPPVDDAGPVDAGSSPDAGPLALRVLFIGNSYTYVNDLPGMLARIAASAGEPPSISVDEVVAGGALLVDLWDAGIAPQRIEERSWTHVVLQGQSQEPMLAGYGIYVDFPGEFAIAAQRFGDLVVDAGAQPVWFVTWARAPGDALYDTYGNSPTEMQDLVTSAYARSAERWPTSVLACVGEAFRRSLELYPTLTLHQADGSHPTVAGTYLAACTFYVALTGRPVPAASDVPPQVAPADAALLREVALVGSHCADVHSRAMVSVSWVFFGLAGTPLTELSYVTNKGESAAGLSDGLTLTPQFSWTQGAYPGLAGTADDDAHTPACTATLAPKSRCALSVSYAASASATANLTLNVTGGYRATAQATVSGTYTDQPVLEFRRDLSTTLPASPTNPASPLVVAAPLETRPFNLFLFNRGGAPATAIAGRAGFTVDPWWWGPVADAGTSFPGGSGSLSIDGGSHPYCLDTLAPGQQCVVTGNYSPSQPGSGAGWYAVEFATDAGVGSAIIIVHGLATDAGL